ncbi:MAG: type III polyketide synthase [Chitinispirillaceae bacterium]
MSETQPRIAALGTALPPCRVSQQRSKELLLNHYGESLTARSREVLCKLLDHPGIDTRAYSFDKEKDLPKMKNENPDKRNERFRKWGVKLSSQACRNALSSLKLKADDITCLIVNTCTGYVCPGLSTYILEDLGLGSATKVYDLVGSGCGGAVPNLQLASALAAQGEKVLSVAVEICSATFEMGNDLSLIVSNSIFGDGAAAAVVWNRPEGIEIVSTRSIQLPKYREDVRYVYREGRLHNQLSHHLPKIIGKTVPGAVDNFLKANELQLNDIRHWFIHPGGEKMLGVLQNSLKLSDKQMDHARGTMYECGNMSSPSVLFELERLVGNGGVSGGDLGIMAAFGAGLSVHLALLKW